MLGLSRLKSWTDCNTFALPEKGMRNSKRSSRNINSQFGTLWMAWSVCVEEYWNSSSECANKQMIQSVIIKFAYRRFSWHILYMRILWTKTRFNEPLKLPSHRNHTHTHMLARSRTHLNRLFQTAISMYIRILISITTLRKWHMILGCSRTRTEEQTYEEKKQMWSKIQKSFKIMIRMSQLAIQTDNRTTKEKIELFSHLPSSTLNWNAKKVNWLS